MVSSQLWARKLTINDEDLDGLINRLLEGETPLSTEALALEAISAKLVAEAQALQERYQGAKVYDPAQQYALGDRLVLPALDFATAEVVGLREGDNPEYGPFNVIQVRLDDSDIQREFAAELTTPHVLNAEDDGAVLLPGANEFDAAQVLAENREQMLGLLEQRLAENDTLASVARQWFPRDLVLEVNEGYLNLAEAVLDINGGGPLTTEEVIEQIGGLGNAPIPLQVFSLNYALKDDKRFDEVGPTGEVLWYLVRLQPEEVRRVPPVLRYTPIAYDRSVLTPEMLALERDLGDELSGLEPVTGLETATFTLIYPHRRTGTMPLNARTRAFFPDAQRADRICVDLIDGQDEEVYQGWVLPHEGYVFGLGKFYAKHKMPIGGYVTIKAGEHPGEIIIDYGAYNPRTEYIPLMSVQNGDKPAFENNKRAIGADYDDLMIIGIESLGQLDELVTTLKTETRSLSSLMKLLLPILGRLTPQGTVHFKTLYSAINLLRRTPPGPMLAMLNANPDFENLGDHYWTLSE